MTGWCRTRIGLITGVEYVVGQPCHLDCPRNRQSLMRRAKHAILGDTQTTCDVGVVQMLTQVGLGYTVKADAGMGSDFTALGKQSCDMFCSALWWTSYSVFFSPRPMQCWRNQSKSAFTNHVSYYQCYVK